MGIITFDNKDLSNKIDRIATSVFKKENVPTQEPEIWLTCEEFGRSA